MGCAPGGLVFSGYIYGFVVADYNYESMLAYITFSHIATCDCKQVTMYASTVVRYCTNDLHL
jgi:hypothetical protein